MNVSGLFDLLNQGKNQAVDLFFSMITYSNLQDLNRIWTNPAK